MVAGSVNPASQTHVLAVVVDDPTVDDQLYVSIDLAVDQSLFMGRKGFCHYLALHTHGEHPQHFHQHSEILPVHL